LFATAALISAFFLILTGAVYLILWEYQNIHGWLQFSYVVSLLFAFTFLAIVQLASDSFDDAPVACEVLGMQQFITCSMLEKIFCSSIKL